MPAAMALPTQMTALKVDRTMNLQPADAHGAGERRGDDGEAGHEFGDHQ